MLGGTSKASLDFGEEADKQRVNDVWGQLAAESQGITVEAGKESGRNIGLVRGRATEEAKGVTYGAQ